MCKVIKFLIFMNSIGWLFLIIDIYFYQWKKLSVIYLLYIVYIIVYVLEYILLVLIKYRVLIYLYMQ